MQHGCDRKSPGIWTFTVFNAHVLRTRLGRVAHRQLRTRALAKALEIKKRNMEADILPSLPLDMSSYCFCQSKPLGDKIFVTCNICSLLL